MPARVRVEGTLAHQAMHAALGAKTAVGIVAGDLERRAFDAGDLARRVLEHLGVEALAVAVLEVHALEHRGPVLSLGAARARLDVDEAVVRIERIGKHAAEFQRRHVLRQPFRFLADFLQGGIVRVSARELEELRGVREPAADAAEGADDRFERLLLLAEVLRALRVLPQLRVFELAVQRREAPGLRLEVKDTSAAPPTAPAGRRGWRRSGSLVRLPSISLPCLPN